MDYTILPSLVVVLSNVNLINDELYDIRSETKRITDELAKTHEQLRNNRYDYDTLDRLEKTLAEMRSREKTIINAVTNILRMLVLIDTPAVQKALLDGGVPKVLTKYTAGLKIVFIHKVSLKPLLEVDLRF